MSILHLKIDESTTDAIIDALGIAHDATGHVNIVHDYGALRTWLIWRRVKRWGERERMAGSSMWPVFWDGDEYTAESLCFECGVPFNKPSPQCPHYIFDRHPRALYPAISARAIPLV